MQQDYVIQLIVIDQYTGESMMQHVNYYLNAMYLSTMTHD